jgi:adenylosuccinate synthase
MIIGTQWGDEGKGKIVDFMAKKADVVARFQGGNNAGHTIVVGNETYKFHLLPSGILRPGKDAVIGNGLVVDPVVLLKELDELKKRKIKIARLHISDRAHVIMPYHLEIDGLEEKKKGKLSAGTTRRGIGPAYTDKIARFGIRMCDLLEKSTLARKVKIIVPLKRKMIKALGGSWYVSESDLVNEYYGYGQKMKKMIRDTSVFLDKNLAKKKMVLFEGAQGTHLDIDHGIYPFGTSSNTIAGGACTGSGLGPGVLGEIVGVVKAYTSRVGEGPFPCELEDEIGEHLRERGGEYGTTTGRPRRCGWLDMVMINYSRRVNGLTSLAITKIDVLSGLKKIKIATHYNYKGSKVVDFPASMSKLSKCKPVYKTFDGWKDVQDNEWDKMIKKGKQSLPGQLKKYLKFIEDYLSVPIKLISLGPQRHRTLVL